MQKPEESAAAGPKFANFPSHEVRKTSSNFKLSPDMPFGFPGGERREEAPRITYRDEEELRYQNNYFKLPDYSNEISNEVMTDFEMIKRLKQKQKSRIRETLNLLTNKYRRTDKKKKKFKEFKKIARWFFCERVV